MGSECCRKIAAVTLRDHSNKCDHGYIRGHGWSTAKPGSPPTDFQRYNKGGGDRWTDHHWCDGGREVTDDDLRMMLDDLAKEMDRPRDYDEARE